MNAEPFSVSKSTDRLGRIAILWRGDEVARRAAAPDTSRFKAVFAALADIGVDAEPVVYEDDVIDAVLNIASNGAITSDNVPTNDKTFLSDFPFLATPHDPSEVIPGRN